MAKQPWLVEGAGARLNALQFVQHWLSAIHHVLVWTGIAAQLASVQGGRECLSSVIPDGVARQRAEVTQIILMTSMAAIQEWTRQTFKHKQRLQPALRCNWPWEQAEAASALGVARLVLICCQVNCQVGAHCIGSIRNSLR